MQPKPSYPIPLVDGEPRNERRKGEVDADHILLLQKYSHPKSGTLHKLRRYQGFIKSRKKKKKKIRCYWYVSSVGAVRWNYLLTFCLCYQRESDKKIKWAGPSVWEFELFFFFLKSVFQDGWTWLKSSKIFWNLIVKVLCEIRPW